MMMKKLSIGLAIILAGVSNEVLASRSCNPLLDVSVPSLCGGFTFGVTGLYWRPSVPYLDYALSFSTVSSVGSSYNSFDPDHDWGYKINVGYIFPCSGNDVQLTYTHYDQDESHHLTGPLLPSLTTPLVAPTFVAPITLDAITLAAGATLVSTTPVLPAVIFPGAILASDPVLTDLSVRAEFEHYSVDLDFGQRINVGSNFGLRWFGGLRYARMENKVQESFTAVTTTTLPTVTTAIGVVLEVAEAATPGIITADVSFDLAATQRNTTTQKVDFDGIGPHFGFEGNYYIGGGFGVVSSVSTGLIVGETDTSLSSQIRGDTGLTPTVVFTETGVAAPFITGEIISGGATTLTGIPSANFKYKNDTRVAPNLDAKLGLNYAYVFSNVSHSRLSVEGGYQVSHYWNTVDRVSLNGPITTLHGNRQTTDISFEGPYIGIQVQV